MQWKDISILCLCHQLLCTILQQVCRKYIFKILLQIQLCSPNSLFLVQLTNNMGYWALWINVWFVFSLRKSCTWLVSLTFTTLFLLVTGTDSMLTLPFIKLLDRHVICSSSCFVDHLCPSLGLGVTLWKKVYSLMESRFLFSKKFTPFHWTIFFVFLFFVFFFRVVRGKQKLEKMWIVINCSFYSQDLE